MLFQLQQIINAYSLLLYACYSLLTLYTCIQLYALYAINLIAYNHTFSFSLCQVKSEKNFFIKKQFRKICRLQNLEIVLI